MSKQLPLQLSFSQHLDLDSFVAEKNSECLDYLRHLTQGKGEKISYLWGKNGLGKTHLLQALCREMNQAGFSVVYLPLAEAVSWPPDSLDYLDRYALICLDDVQAIANKPEWQEALFHLINRQYAQQDHYLILTGNQPVNGLSIQLPDLLSRFAWGVVYQLHELDDQGKAEAIRRRASNKGFEVGDEVLEYLFRHYTRDLPSMLCLLDQMDHASLSEQRKITVPFVRKLLQ